MRKKNKNPFTEAQRSLDEARDAFIRAAAALSLPVRYDKDALVTAILEGSYGLLKALEGDDPHSRATTKAREYLTRLQ